jgi:arylsulfate sulfotransferase
VVRRLALFVAIASVSVCSHALTISSGPAFMPASNAPLAGVLTLTTDQPSRVSVSVSDGTNTWARKFYDYRTAHFFPLLGFKPGRTNQITVTVHDKYGNEFTAPEPAVFITGPLPSDFPTIVLLESKPEKMEPGYTLSRLVNRNDNKAYLSVVDSSGEVIWYSAVPTTSDVRQLENGDLFIPLTTNFVEINMLGNTVNTWVVPAGLTINLHDGVPTGHGTILYLNDASRVLTNFPTSASDSNAPTQTTSVLYNRIVEISATNASLLNLWSPIDVLDPRLLTYLTFDSHVALGWDIEHANALIEDPRDNSIIVSMRNQNLVFKFSRETGLLKWILGPHENWGPAFQQYLLTPVSTPFEWQYGQHAPMITPQGTLLLYDDGNVRASPFNPSVPDANNYSRAVEYEINEEKMEVSQVWDYGRTNADRLFTDRVGNADWLPQRGNVLINFGYIIYTNGFRPSPFAPAATMVRIKEVTHEADPEVVFDLAYFDYGNTSSSYRGCFAYRSHRIPDLYSIEAQPVQDLIVEYEDGKPNLVFSANPARTYIVEASTNLVQWEELGTSEHDGSGNFHFEDMEAGDFPARYYRVVTR